MTDYDADGCGAGIAIVEDDKNLVEMYKKILMRKGFNVCFVAYDGYEAINKFTDCTSKPSIVIMDNRLQSMHGVEATREILNIEPRTKIIFLSADITVEKDAIDAGAFLFLKKPASTSEIIKAIKSAC